MEIKISEIVNASQAFNNLASKDLPIKVAYSVGKVLKSLLDTMRLIDSVKMELIIKYREPNSDVVRVDAAKQLDYIREWNDYLASTISLDINKLKLSLLDDFSYINMTPGEMASLMPFIEDDENS